MNEVPHVHLDILVIKDDKILLGMPSKKWLQGEESTWGVPGDDIRLGETFDAAVTRNLTTLFNCNHSSLTILGAHENFAYGNHYIGIGCLVTVEDEIDLQRKSEDWVEWKWFFLDALPDELFVSVRMTLEEYRRFL